MNKGVDILQWNSLHNHFKWSKLDSMVNIDEFLGLAKEYNMTGVAITDHGVVGGIVEFYEKCIKYNIKPVLGSELYFTEDLTIKTRAEMEELNYHTYHLILYAKNDIGLGNLYNIASLAANDGLFDGYERIDLKHIIDHNLAEGIICTTACLGGPIANWLFDNHKHEANIEKALEMADLLKEVFKDDLYIELGCNSMELQIEVNSKLIEIAKEKDIKLLISGDVHYVNKEDAKIHEILLCMSTKTVLANPDRFKFPCDDMYLLHPENVYNYCIQHNIPLSAIENTLKIVEECNASPYPKVSNELLPRFEVSSNYNEDTYIMELTLQNLIELAQKKNINYIDYLNRAQYELNIIASKGYSGYFLILLDIIQFCKRDPIIFTPEFEQFWYVEKQYPKETIMTGPGRGSAAGSIVSYLTGITKLDPIVHGLFFERFLDVDKDAFPDIDSDFEDLRRQEVIDYILWKYGVENTAAILTYTELKLKSGLRSIMKVLGYTTAEIDEITKSVPEKMPDQSDPDLQLFRDIRDTPHMFFGDYGDKLENITKKVLVFWNYMDKYPDVEEALIKLEGIIASVSVHASAIIITPPNKLYKSIPTRFMKKSLLPVSQLSMGSIETIRALKLDILGLKTLSVISIASDFANIDKNILDTEDYDNNPEIYETIRNGYTKQIFQLSSSGITRMCKDMNLENFEETTDALALYRPGPLGAKDDSTGLTMVESYIEAKKSGVIPSIHKDIDHILAQSKGCLVYQEQLLLISQKIAGYTLGQADKYIRKPVGKKKIKEFPAIRQQFVYGDENVPGAIKMGYTKEFGNSLFDMIIKFGGYGFNRSHSACYADLSWKTGYLKTFHTAAYMAAVMSVRFSYIDQITDCIVECKKMGIEVLQPDINLSKAAFTLETLENGKIAIRYGFTAIRGIGIPVANEIVKYQPYTSLDDFMNKIHNPNIKRFKNDGKKASCPLSKKTEPLLIQTGAFDKFEKNRYKLLNEYMKIRKEKKYDPLDESKYSRAVTLELEKEHLGTYVSDHPLKTLPFISWNEWEHDEKESIGGVIRKIELKTNKKGNPFITGTIETLEDKRRFIVHDKVYKQHKDKIIKDEKIVITGFKNNDFDNINVTDVKTIVFIKKEQEEAKSYEIDLAVFGGEDFDPKSRT